MLDIQFIRDNADLVSQKSSEKGYQVDVGKLLEIDALRRTRLTQIDELRKRRNELSSGQTNNKPDDTVIAEGKSLKQELAKLEADLKQIENQFDELIKTIPNMPIEDVPVGQTEADNVVSKQVGSKPEFSFEIKSHWEIADKKDLIDKERATKVAGPRFAYIKGDLVRLQFAIIQFVIATLSDESIIGKLISENKLQISSKPFTPILPPAMIKTDVFAAMDRLEPREDRYQVGDSEDDLWLQGSAEHTLGSMYKDEIIPESSLPIRMLGYSTSFRREAGTYGKDTEGIIRMHQFDKLEMEVFSTSETGLDEHKLLCAVQEYLVQQLALPYQVLQKCTADIGKPNARGIDIEVWMPGQAKYRETHTADYMTDYQARRLKTRVKKSDGTVSLVHTNDATAFALGRLMATIIENYQTEAGNFRVPEVLQPYMGFKKEI